MCHWKKVCHSHVSPLKTWHNIFMIQTRFNILLPMKHDIASPWTSRTVQRKSDSSIVKKNTKYKFSVLQMLVPVVLFQKLLTYRSSTFFSLLNHNIYIFANVSNCTDVFELGTHKCVSPTNASSPKYKFVKVNLLHNNHCHVFRAKLLKSPRVKGIASAPGTSKQ